MHGLIRRAFIGSYRLSYNFTRSAVLAEKGYDVTAVELVDHNLNILKSKSKTHHNIKIYKGNAVDLSFLESAAYDLVLLLGPMYHLFTSEDKRRALSEAIRISKKGGTLRLFPLDTLKCKLIK